MSRAPIPSAGRAVAAGAHMRRAVTEGAPGARPGLEPTP
jgi:hypothetical protein